MDDELTVRLGGGPARTTEPGRPLSATAAMGGAVAVLITLVLCMYFTGTRHFFH